MIKKWNHNRKDNIQDKSRQEDIPSVEERLHKDSQIKIEELILIIILVIVCGILFYWQNQLAKQLDEARRVISTMDAQITSYKENDALTKSNAAEQQEKIQLLSDTLASKTEQLTAYQDAEAALRVPNAYPVKGSATILSSGLLDETQIEQEEDPDQLLMEIYTDMADDGEEVQEENIQPNLMFMVSDGTCITATGTGRVVEIKTNEKGYKTLRIDHENGYESVYKCLGNVLVNEGDSVSSGSVLMSVTENASYFEYQIIYENNYMNPQDCMTING